MSYAYLRFNMNQLSESEIKKKLKAAFWDRDIDINELYMSLIEEKEDNYPVDQNLLFSRILISIDWYSLLKIVPKEKWKHLFNKNVINLLFPKSIQKRYSYAGRVLLQ